ncbi:MAG: hypothetical protein GY778_12045 [bacterium]|nr:hypothetical protein [bacterium]
MAQLGDHPWAGSYYHGDGLGVNADLRIAPESGFVFVWTGCLGVYDRNYGDVVVTDRGTIEFSFTFVNNQDGFRGTAPEVVPIRWSDRRYLIPVDDVVEFCNWVNDRGEPRNRMHGFWYLRQGDHEKPVTGAPELPEEYQACLLNETVFAEIIEIGETTVKQRVGGWFSHTTPVKINVGREEKILPGMSFNIYRQQDTSALLASIRVVNTDEHTSSAILEQMQTDDRPPPVPEVGWKLTTGSRRKALVQEAGNRASATVPD